jgi:hypothetical protein
MTNPGTELISVLLVLLPVVVGGALALFSGGYVQKLRSKAESEKRRAEKFEELVTALYEQDHWLEDVRNYRVLGEEAPRGLAPLSKVLAISTVYFPELQEKITAFGSISQAYEVWMLGAAQRRIDNVSAVTEGHKEAVSTYLAGRNSLLKDLETYAFEEFGARK